MIANFMITNCLMGSAFEYIDSYSKHRQDEVNNVEEKCTN